MILINSNAKAFLAVIECGTVSGAGKILGLTQTAVTQRIRALEEEVGVSLFIRSKSGMKVTDEGGIVYRHCLAANGIENELQSLMRKLGKETDIEFNIAGISSIVSGRILFQIADVLQKWPRLSVNYHIESHDTAVNSLKSGKTDLTVLRSSEVIPELTSKPLRPIEFKLMATKEWKKREFKEILKNERMICFSKSDEHSVDYLDIYNLGSLLGRKRVYTNENRALQNQIELGLGFGLLPKELADPLIKQGKAFAMNSGRTMNLPISLAWYGRSEMPAYMKEIIDAIE
jgi:LysR family transcriptional regulator, chromosome initiation inhibitor